MKHATFCLKSGFTATENFIKRTFNIHQLIFLNMQVTVGRIDPEMPEQFLDVFNVDTVFQQVRRKTMPQTVKA